MTRIVIRRRHLLAAIALTAAVPAVALAGDLRYAPDRIGPDADTSRTWPRNLVRALQQRLAERGLDPGPVDGLYGARTAAAIRQLQAMEGLEPDGLISDAVLERVRLARPE